MARVKTDDQMRLEDLDADYKKFVDKFKAKKTTDDCYTPANVYEVICRWACKEYGIDPARIVRPFWPGADYQRFEYEHDAVVLDNPPFSILTQIIYFYLEYDIKFFLFTPYLTNLGICRGDRRVQHIVTEADITYENGATVNTSFITNLDRWFIRSAPDLNDAIARADAENRAKMTKSVPKYEYPGEVIRSTDIGYLSCHGVDFRIGDQDVAFTAVLDQQRQKEKSIYGAGFLLSERAAAERAAAERAAAEYQKKKNTGGGLIHARWELSQRERLIVQALGKTGDPPQFKIYTGEE